MGFKTRAEVIAAGMDFVKECYAIADKFEEDFEYDADSWLADYELRVEDQMIEFEWLYSAEDVEDAMGYCSEANCTVEELTDEEFTDGVILCEGFLYEALYGYQGDWATLRLAKKQQKLYTSV